MKEYILFQSKNCYNKKSHVLCYQYFPQLPNIKIYESEYELIIKTINEKNEDNVCILFYCQNLDILALHCKVLDYLKKTFKPNQIKAKLIFFVFDYWYFGDKNIHTKYFNKAAECINNYMVSTAPYIDDFYFFHRTKYNLQKIILNRYWCAYDNAFIEFNETPINKIGLSGEVCRFGYPERFFVEKHKEYVEKIVYDRESVAIDNDKNNIDNNSFNKTLNKYLCCFTSSIRSYVRKSDKPMVSTHVILLKVFEILAAGSLLLYPLSEKQHIEKLGLEENIHYMLCDCEDTAKFTETCKYILDPTNREKINEIRRNGQEFARKELRGEAIFKSLMEKIESL